MKLKSILALALMLVLFAVGSSVAAAAKLPQPVLGAWKFGDGGGFTLKKGGGKVLLTDFHVPVLCEGATVKATLLGSRGLTVFTRGGYSTWGVGKNVGGEAEPTPARVKADGKTYGGEFSVIWNYEDPARSVLGASISFNGCSAELLSASPK